MRRRRIERDRNGRYKVRLASEERELLANLPAQLEQALAALASTSAAPPSGFSRLFPAAYPTDPEAEAAYVALQRSELVDRRRAALSLLATTSGATELDDEQIASWLGALNDLRLVLGTTLGVTEDDTGQVDADNPLFAEWQVYGYLSYLVSEIIDALSGALPPPRVGADDLVPEDPWGEPPGGLRWDGTSKP
jgi:hypothetical protein